MPLAEPLPGRDLAAFVTAVETGTIQGAADALALTQSAATKRLQALERRLGVDLLRRGARGVTPTEAGAQLYPLAREALAALTRAETALAAGGSSPVLAIHASRTIGETLLPGWIAAFTATSTRCHASVTITNSEEVVHAVREGEAMLGFIEGPAGPMRGLTEMVVAHDELQAVVAPDHPWARRASVPARALTSQRFLAREVGSGTRAMIEAALSAVGVSLQPSLELSSAEGLKRAVLSGSGFTLLSSRAVEAEARSGTLIAIPVSGAALQRELRAVRRSRAALSGPGREFWRFLERTVAPAP